MEQAEKVKKKIFRSSREDSCLTCIHCTEKGGNFTCDFKKADMGGTPYYKSKGEMVEMNFGIRVCEFKRR